jgi:hypothetical protein
MSLHIVQASSQDIKGFNKKKIFYSWSMATAKSPSG